MRHLLALLFACGVSQAGTISTSVTGPVEVGSTSLAFCQQSGTSSAACSDSEGAISLSLQANADFGNLSATAFGSGGQLDIFAQSSFADMLTIDAAGVPSGFVDYSFLFTGHTVSTGQGLVVRVQQDGVLIGLFTAFPPDEIGTITNNSLLTSSVLS